MEAHLDAKEQQQQLTSAAVADACRLANIAQALDASSEELKDHMDDAQAAVKEAQADAEQQECLADIKSYKKSLIAQLAELIGKVTAIALICWICWYVVDADG